MSIISNTPWGMGVSPHLRKVLNRVGVDATVTTGQFGQYILNVTDRGSRDVRSYEISAADAAAIADGHTDSAFKKGYAVVAARAKDFNFPPVAYARSVNPFVNNGYSGYRMWGDDFAMTYAPGPGMSPYGPYPMPRHGVIGYLSAIFGRPAYRGPYGINIWTTGYPGRQAVGGEIPYNTRVTRKDSGTSQAAAPAPARTANVDIGTTRILNAVPSPWWEKQGAIPVPKAYSEVIPKSKDFTVAKFKEVLASHGIDIDEAGKEVSIKSKALHSIPTISLVDDKGKLTENARKLLSPHLVSGKDRKGHKYTGVSLDERLAILSEMMKKAGFTEGITKADLENKKDDLYRGVTEKAQEKYDGKSVNTARGVQAAQDVVNRWAPMLKDWGYSDMQIRNIGYNLQSYAVAHPEFAKLSPDEALAFLRDHPDAVPEVTRVLQYGNAPGIWQGGQAQGQGTARIEAPKVSYKTGFIDAENAIAVVDGRALDKEKGFYLPVKDGKAVTVGEIIATPVGIAGKGTSYQMSAVINGQVYTHDIKADTYAEFANSDDEHRLEVFDKVFDEVAIKGYKPGGGENYAVPSGNIKEAQGAVSLGTNYSIINNNTFYIIEDATAVHDMAKNDYTLNIRESGDAGVWQFKMTPAQFEEWSKSDDAHKAEMINTIANFHDRFGNSYKTIADREILSGKAYRNISMGKGLSAGGMHEVTGVTVYEGDKSRAGMDPKSQPKWGSLQGDRKYSIDPHAASNPDGLLRALDDSEKKGTHKGVDASAPQHHKWAEADNTDVVRLATEEGVAKDEIVFGQGQKDLAALRKMSNRQIRLQLDGIAGENYVNGRTAEGKMENRMWTRSGSHGRQTDVSDIRVDQIKDAEGKPTGKYRMSALIDGALVTHEISQKKFQDFFAKDDYGKLKLFDDVFTEVKMKHIPGTGSGNKIIAGIAAALGIAAGVVVGADMWRRRPEAGPVHGGFRNHLVEETMMNSAINFDLQANADDRPDIALTHGRG